MVEGDETDIWYACPVCLEAPVREFMDMCGDCQDRNPGKRLIQATHVSGMGAVLKFEDINPEDPDSRA